MDKRLNILVTGANGQLGSELRNVTAGSEDRYIFSDINRAPGVETLFLDITNIDAVRIVCDSEDIDVIINCAGYTNVDKAEDDLAMADLLNRQAVGNLAAVAAERDAALVHISTDYVFRGDATCPYREADVPCPQGVYGNTKYAGERAVRDSGCRHLILRTAWLYSPFGHNFVKTMLRLTAEKRELKVVYDQVGCPTYSLDLACFIFNLLTDRRFDVFGTGGGEDGLFHFSNEGAISWYDFACAIMKLGAEADAARGLEIRSCRILPCLSEEYPSKVKRPHFSVFDKSKVKRTFGISIPHWHDSLESFMKRINSGT